MGAATVVPDLPDADVRIADKGHDGDWFRKALTVQRVNRIATLLQPDP